MVGVEKQQHGRADHLLPYPHRYIRSRDRNAHHPSRVLGADFAGVDRLVTFLLLIGQDLLAEKVTAVEDADAGQRQGEVARRLEVITGENSEASRVLRYLRRYPELRRETGNIRRVDRRHQCLQFTIQGVDASAVRGQPRIELPSRSCSNRDQRVESRPRPGNGREKIPRRMVPRPTKIRRERDQGIGRHGQDGPERSVAWIRVKGMWSDRSAGDREPITMAGS